jgi:hypothetical protein
MDQEAGKAADTDSEPAADAAGSAASADEATTQPIVVIQKTDPRDAGPQGAELREAGPREAGGQEPASKQTGRRQATSRETGRRQATSRETGRPQATSQETGRRQATSQETGRPQATSQETDRDETGRPQAGSQETDRHETGRQETGQAARTPAGRTPASLTPVRRTLARAGDKNLARTPGREPAEAARRGRVSLWAQPPRRLVPALRPVFPALATDPRLPIWIARMLTATAAGVAVTIWQDWRLGLTAAAAVVILDIIYRSRTTSVIPAAVRVTSAQRRTRRRLALLRGRGYVALNARAIPGSDSVIDHLVIGPPGVFALDSERWDRRLPVRTAASGRLYHGPFGQEERLKHAVWEAAQASSLVGASLGRPISVRPAMAIYGPTIPWTVASLREVDVLAGRRLRKYFRRQARAAGPQLDADQVSQIHAAAAEALPPAR